MKLDRGVLDSAGGGRHLVVLVNDHHEVATACPFERHLQRDRQQADPNVSGSRQDQDLSCAIQSRTMVLQRLEPEESGQVGATATGHRC